MNVGHTRPELIRAANAQAEKLTHSAIQVLGYEPYVLRFGMIGWNAETKVKVAGAPGQAPEVVHGLGGPIER